MVDLLRENWFGLLLLGGLLTAGLVLRTEGAELASTEEYDQLVQSAPATVVEFFTNT
jgi:hypothetical protein